VSLEAPRSSGLGGWLVTIILLAILAGGGYFFLPQLVALTSKPASDRGILTHTIGHGRLLVTVTEDGNVESARNLDVKCQVAGGTSIQWIIQDGKEVEQGDELVKLDQSTIDEQLNTQKIAFEKAQASKIQADEDHGAAEIGVKEYVQGTFLKDQQLAESTIRIAKENLKTAENMLSYTQRMARKGFATPLQAEADTFAVERGKLDLEAAETSKRVLVEFTKFKMLKELEAKRETAAARVRSEEASFNLEKGRLDRLTRQLANCVIKAPQKGMVVYANEAGGRGMGGSQSPKVEEGATVREGQTLIRLPDLSNMQVKVIVHESKVDLIKRGFPGRIKIGDRQLDGTVVFVANQPEPASWMNANVKEYATTVTIEGETIGLKPGMTAEVEILIDDLNDVPLIPVSAVVEQRGKFFAWVKTAGAPERRQLTLGRTNDKMIHVVDGVKQGDEVLLNPRAVVSDARDEGSESDERTDDRFKKADGSTTKGDAKPGQPDSSSSKKSSDTAGGAVPPGSGGEGGDETAKKSAKRPQFNIMSLDKDGDKKVSRDEASAEGAPSFLGNAFDFMDANKDGFIDAAEVAESRKRMQQGGGGRPGGPGGAPTGGAP
jgi:multidrug efflux pump subunit AcrA (membrane-fusion protein)